MTHARLARLMLAALAVGLVVWVLATGSYLVTALGFAAAYAVFVSGLNLFMGVAGQVSFGQSAFAAVGGYGSAVLTTTYGWEPLAAMAVSATVAGVLAAAVGAPTLRLRGHYLAMATLALGLITYELSIEWDGLTQGYMGITGIPPFGIGRFMAGTDVQAFLVLAAAVALTLLANHRLARSRFGRALSAVAGSEDAARALGIAPMRAKLSAFVIAAVEASVAGSLLAHFVGFVSPEVFGLHMVVQGFTMLYIGGIGTLLGPVIGAVVVTLLPEMFRGFRDYQDLAYGAALLLLLIHRPKGIASLLPRRSPRAGSGETRVWDSRAKPGKGGELLRVEHVTRRFSGLVALDDVSFSVREGGVHAIIGPNGAGKTTLFNVISGFTAPSAGRVLFAGETVSGRPPPDIAARGLVRTFQLVRLFTDRTAAENVEVGCHLSGSGGIGAALLRLPFTMRRERETAARARGLLARVGLSDRADMPAAQLPYGEQRLLEIARALAAGPRLLLLDEPAAGLNAKETDRLAAIISAIAAGGVTVLLIEHDMGLVMRLAETILVLDQGRRIAEGPPEAVSRDPAVLDAYLGGLDELADA